MLDGADQSVEQIEHDRRHDEGEPPRLDRPVAEDETREQPADDEGGHDGFDERVRVSHALIGGQRTRFRADRQKYACSSLVATETMDTLIAPLPCD